MFRCACLLFCILVAQNCHALTLDYEACGFVDKSDGKTFHPAAVYRTDDTFYLITNEAVNGQEHDFYYRDEHQQLTTSAIVLLSGPRRNPYVGIRDRLLVFTVPIDSIDQELAQILYSCAVQASDFVESRVGQQVVIHSQTKSLDVPGPLHRGVVGALNHFGFNMFITDEAYSLIQPPSPGATVLSWVTEASPIADSSEVRVVGLLAGHVSFIKGDRYFCKELVRAVMTGDDDEAQSKGLTDVEDKAPYSCLSAFVSGIDADHIQVDDWKAVGDNSDEGLFDKEFLRVIGQSQAAKFGFPAFVVAYLGNQYLVLQSGDITAIQSDSNITTQVDGQSYQVPLNECFEMADGDKIAIGPGLVAFKNKADLKEKNMKFKTINLDDQVAVDIQKLNLLGVSIVDWMLMEREKLEESLVYCTGVENDPLNSDVGGMDFDSGVYPAALYASESCGGLFAGILCKDASKILTYSAEQIRIALDSKK